MKQQKKYNTHSGIYFDLHKLYDTLNHRFFDDSIVATVTWGKRRPPKDSKKKSIRLGSYHPHAKKIIINPCLDQAIVPTICVERILFHEMTHQRFPVKTGPHGKRLIHYREFYDFERRYPYVKEADAWIKAHLDRLLAW